jgi:hypothetical protein
MPIVLVRALQGPQQTYQDRGGLAEARSCTHPTRAPRVRQASLDARAPWARAGWSPPALDRCGVSGAAACQGERCCDPGALHRDGLPVQSTRSVRRARPWRAPRAPGARADRAARPSSRRAALHADHRCPGARAPRAGAARAGHRECPTRALHGEARCGPWCVLHGAGLPEQSGPGVPMRRALR